MVELRDYQIEFVEGIRAAFARNRRVLGVSPTGSGKTVTFSYITQGAAAKGNRVMLVAHRSEIVDQISRSLDQFGVRHGRIQAGRPMIEANCHVAMIQTLANRVDRIPAPQLLIVDEAHHAVSKTYSKLLEQWPNTKVLGVTATPERLDGVGLRMWFDEMVLGPTPLDLINAGHLAKYDYLAPPTKIDMSGVKVRAGDYAIDAMAEALEKSTIVGDAIEHYQRHLDGRPVIVFCVTVAHAEAVAERFNAVGIPAASVDGTMSKEDRAARIQGIGNGTLLVLTSCELISEGVDIPIVSGAILMRPTQSLGMFLQQVGRCLRPKPDGSRAIILDHVGNVHHHGMPDDHRQWSLDSKKRKPQAHKTKTCDVCYRVFDTSEPKWRDAAVCSMEMPEDCALLPPPPADEPRPGPVIVSGTLQPITPAWAGGADIRTAPLMGLVKKAKTREQLEQIARAKGYKPGWVHFVQKGRNQWKRPT